MNFVSPAFAVLFAAVLAARLTIGRRKTERSYIGVLIVAGAVFYGWHVPAYLLLLLTSTSVDFAASIALGRLRHDRRGLRRTVLAASLGTNLGLLSLFKYGDLIVRTLARAVGLFGDVPPLPSLGWVLPIGISFYTFEAMSYTIDVYRGQLTPLSRFSDFFLFISFFPHLVAGPIVRAREFLPQIPRPRPLRLHAMYEGLWLITSGLFLKTVCADNLAAFVNRYWNDAIRSHASPSHTALLVVMFSGQIFADFAGYSNIARGLAYVLGFRLPINFNAPYIAASFRNFWERWHITLSRWLRDYLYVPLGGNRRGATRTYANLGIVMLLGGLWHGAAYRFVVWGGIHGAALAGERRLGLHTRAARPVFVRAIWFIVVQAAVLCAWVFFRSDGVRDAFALLRNFSRVGPLMPPRGLLAGGVFLLPILAVHVWTWLEERRHVAALGPFQRAALVGVMAYAIVMMRGATSDFIYFQF
ncbi:MAG TPA: MBOAT family O-acyltransferase [Vicinamibacterales bacterium]|nr:MBOAT family O-acyltransferase [Vicinamibacterales bacterium]